MTDITDFPNNVTSFTTPQALEFYQKELKQFIPGMLGDTKARLLDLMQKPYTTKELENLTGKPYQTIKSAIKDLEKRGILGSTEYQYHKGRSYYTNFKSLLEHIATTPYGAILLGQYGISAPIETNWSVNRTPIYSEFPEPVGPVLELKLGNERTDVFKTIIASGRLDSRFAKLFRTSMGLIQHVWYRSYLITEGGQTPETIAEMSPNAAESRAAIRSMSKQIKEYSKLLDSLTENELIWSENPKFESWRVIGDIPFQWAMEACQGIINAWNDGTFSTLGRADKLNTDYEDRKNKITNGILEQWIAYQKTLNQNQEN